MALQDTLNTKLPALLQGFDTAPNKADFARKELGKAKQDFMAAEEEAALGEAALKRGVQEKEFKTQEEFAKKERGVVEKYQGMRQEQAPFDATQFQLTPEQAAADSLKMLIGGLLFGGIAKTSAGVALEATLKMREARDKNLQNDYNIALQQYEQADKRIREHNKNLLNEMTQALQLLSTDKAAALSKAKMIEGQIEDGVIKSKLRAGNWKSVIDDMQKVVTEDDKRKAEKEKLEFQRQTQIDVANIRAARPDADEGRLKMTAQPEARLSSSMEGLQALGELEKRLQDPKVKKAIDSSQFFRTLLESPKELYPIEKLIRSQIYQSLPKEAQEVFVDVAMARNDYYRQISGQAVTGSEAARNFFATLQPTDSTDTMLLKIGRVKPRYERNLTSIREGYEIPKSTLSEIDRVLSEYGSQKQAAPARQTGTTNIDTERQEALQAIEKGAPRDAVAKRFKERTGQDL